MKIYSSESMNIDLQGDTLIQNWTTKPTNFEAFAKEIMNFSELNKKVKCKTALWVHDNLDFIIPTELHGWLDRLNEEQYNLGTTELLFTIPKDNSSFSALLDVFSKIDSTYHPTYFSNKESALNHLEVNKNERPNIISDINTTANSSKVNFNISVKPDKTQFVANHINKLKSIGHLYDEYTERYDSLTKREQEVFRLIISGLTNPEISEVLFLSRETIKSHRKSIIKKLNIRNLKDWLYYASLFSY